MISEAVLDAEVRIGALTAQIPKAPGGRPKETIFTAEQSFDKPKSEVVRELGFNQSQIQRFEKLAKHPEIVEEAKAEAREQGNIATRQAFLPSFAIM